jgi:sporulation protein YhbH
MVSDSRSSEDPGSSGSWYDLFSRGARDWLRHNEKVREAVRAQLPDLISQADIAGTGGDRRVQVPVRLLEHYRFRLAESDSETGVGQGEAKPGDVLGREQPGAGEKGDGGSERGEIQFVLELTVDDIVDWLWEELKLPNLTTKAGGIEESDYTREGWDRRGARSRLDRRRSLKEAIKRRTAQEEGPPFSDLDLRYRQLIRRKRPASEAAVFFVMDVSASMTQHDRRLAKTFFFWVVQGLRRQYRQISTVFIAHTESAWEFDEQQFFQVSGTGGTVASTAFEQVLHRIEDQFTPDHYNLYTFYASDGENFPQDRQAALGALTRLAAVCNYAGFVEIAGEGGSLTEMGRLFSGLERTGGTVGTYRLTGEGLVWDAIRRFFRERAEDPAA